jgi:hypothetical protein
MRLTVFSSLERCHPSGSEARTSEAAPNVPSSRRETDKERLSCPDWSDRFPGACTAGERLPKLQTKAEEIRSFTIN